MSQSPIINGKQIDQAQWDEYEAAALRARQLFAKRAMRGDAFINASREADELYADLSSSGDEFAV